MPGIVILVSAMLVARITLRVLAGAGSNTFCCWDGGSAANSGHDMSFCCLGRNCDEYSLTRLDKDSIAS